MVTCAMAQPFVSVALKQGLDAEALLEPTGLTLQQVRAGEELMAAQHWYNLMETVAEQIQTPTLGFQLGRQLALEELPNLRKLRTDHATLGDLLSTLVIEAASLTSLADYELRIGGRIAHLSSERTFKPSQPPLQADGYFCGFIVQLAHTCVGTDWRGKEFEAALCNPTCVPKGADGGIVTKAGSLKGAAFTFPATWLLYRFEAALSQSFSAPNVREQSFMQVVRRTLELHLDNPALNFETLAMLLAKKPRELKSSLEDHETSFRKELETCRKERAEILLSTTDLSSAAVGTRVGMPDPSAFARAFKRWTGMTPTAYRQVIETSSSD